MLERNALVPQVSQTKRQMQDCSKFYSSLHTWRSQVPLVVLKGHVRPVVARRAFKQKPENAFREISQEKRHRIMQTRYKKYMDEASSEFDLHEEFELQSDLEQGGNDHPRLRTLLDEVIITRSAFCTLRTTRSDTHWQRPDASSIGALQPDFKAARCGQR